MSVYISHLSQSLTGEVSRTAESALRTPNGIRTRATSVKERYPRPLDDGSLETYTVLRELPETRYRVSPSRMAPPA